MPLEFNTGEKLRAMLAQIDRLLLSDFPHSASENALDALKPFFIEQQSRLSRAIRTANAATIRQTCSTINERIHQHLPILGFILRSTNVRNSFEAYHALLDCAVKLIGSDAKFILSSEWDFSPLTYPLTVSVLPKYVLLGLPAFESGNALVLPLAGHELGHSVWQNEDLETFYSVELEQSARSYIMANWGECQKAFQELAGAKAPTDQDFSTDIFLAYIVAEISALALSQSEEIFCDGVGSTLFGASYVYAFHYLLAPNMGGYRSPDYPPLKARGGFIVQHSGIDTPSLGFADYPGEFADRPHPMSPRDTFLLKVADTALSSLAGRLFAQAKTVVSTAAPTHMPNVNAEIAILNLFEHGIPAENSGTLGDILNAGWKYVVSRQETHHASERPLVEWISELIFKSIEVVEYRDRLA